MNTVAPQSETTFAVPLSETLTERKTDFQTGKKEPKRVIHFSDGTIEEYSTDEDEDVETYIEKKNQTQVAAINPSTMTWVPWVFYQTVFVGNKALAVCDYLGEYLAGFFGIISPKYEYEIEHYKKMLAEEKERKKEDVEFGGWSKQENIVIASEQFTQRSPDPLKWTHDIKRSFKL